VLEQQTGASMSRPVVCGVRLRSEMRWEVREEETVYMNARRLRRDHFVCVLVLVNFPDRSVD
jgi:hypothetical protein